jgi:hypothetical protein
MESFSEVLWDDFASDHNLDLMVQDLWEMKTDPRAVAEKTVKQWLMTRNK